ncbi:MAG TPA: alpha/beta hydrolase [Ktedonobacteraceae bacterium]|jgi:pimeloyl-ACP methyl ester carboxylesterase|nr:alpha/beta hydrolase [Ktedonobacteraceae bacterium]
MSLSSTSTRDFTVRLRDGRSMGVAVVGPEDGFPIVHFHGSGSSRLEVDLLAADATARGVKLIGIDRPGMGRSDMKVNYRLLDWPDDVIEVTDQLGHERFAIEGLSAGGPYAMACAYKIPQRLISCGLISTVPPPEFMRKTGPVSVRALWWLGAHFPWFVRLYAQLVQNMVGVDETSIEKYLLKYSARLGTADQKLLGNAEIRKSIVRAMVESYRQSGKANLEATLGGVQPWGFQVEQITFEKMFLWHGEQDRIMPVAPARLLAQALPHCTASFYPDEGHFSTIANHAQDIFRTLTLA